MGVFRADVELQFAAQLRRSGEHFQADVFLLKQSLISNGIDAATVPGFTVSCDIAWDSDGVEVSRTVWLKSKGVWSPIHLETRAPGFFVLHAKRD